eukprot:TRINITY_DN12743_c0_g1_i1.p1 TRINITY_DN12743_c0_g1~~TRINITY_DN12743_c0_g1_i1.p1  ORF type:complete len:524 (-),score=96.34 TRINITY_DN12743_c0_g1_i1:84-1511(-)
MAVSSLADPSQTLETLLTSKLKRKWKDISPDLSDGTVSGNHKSMAKTVQDSKKENSKKEATISVSSESDTSSSLRPPFPPSYYVLTEEQLQENGYPCESSRGFLSTSPAPPGCTVHDMLSLDCEMCYTSEGLELTRVTVVDKEGKVLLDKLVKPSREITNYNTRYSGITSEMMANVTTTLQDIQEEVFSLVYSETILVGHSLECDLSALKIIHTRVIDTALLYRHLHCRSFKPALRKIAKKFLNRDIQFSEHGHDSIEDARTAMDLALLKIKNGPTFGNPRRFIHPKLVSVLSDHGRVCSLIDRKEILQKYAQGSCNAILSLTDDDALKKVIKEVRKEHVNFIWTQFTDILSYQTKQTSPDTFKKKAAEIIAMATCSRSVSSSSKSAVSSRKVTPELQEILQCIDKRVKALYNSLPTNGFLIISTGHGDTDIVRRLRELLQQEASDKIPREKILTALENLQAEAETALGWFCVKQ